jgi:hypothetical protein
VTSSIPPAPASDSDSAEPPLPPDLSSTPFPWPGLDRLGTTQAIGGLVLGLIALFSSYDHITIAGSSVQLQQQWGVVFILASVATVLVDAQLASRSRLREAHERLEERDRAAEAREQADSRARVQARCLDAQSRFLLLDTPRNRRQLSEAAALLMEQLRLG